MFKTVKSIVAAGAMLAMTVAPAVAADDIIIAGNGYDSDNTATVVNTDETAVIQGNATIVVTIAEVKSDTGDNHANNNTTGSEGDPTVISGDATSVLKIKVEGGDNTATLPDPCGCPEDGIVKIADNGAKSTNTATVTDTSGTLVAQGNLTGVLTIASVKSKTGDNTANNNTGSGKVKVKSGSAKSTLKIKVKGSSNTLTP